MKRLKEYAAAAFLLVCIAAVMAFPQDTAEGIGQGLELCTGKIIPSIFPMMLLCVMIVECGYAEKLGKLLAPVTRRVFCLPGEAGVAVLMSMTGGYPAGAKTVMSLYERGVVTLAQARRMALFCFCAGPAFLIGVVGGLTGSTAHGWLLMAVQVIAVTITGILVCRIGKKEEHNDFTMTHKSCGSMAGAIVASVSKSADALLQVCLYVVIFSAANELLVVTGCTENIIGILTSIGVKSQTAQAVIPVLLEVTGGCIRAVGAGLPMTAFAVGFGGLSVQMQVLALTESLGINKGLFFACRLMQGTISALLTAAAMEFLPEGMAVPASTSLNSASLSGSPQGAVMLLIMCAMCVLCMPSNSVIVKERA